MFNSRPWSQEDTQVLLKNIADKKKLEEIAKLQKRTVTSIQSKLKIIAANMYLNEQLPYEDIETKTGIKKESLIVKRVIKKSELSGSPKDTSEDMAVDKSNIIPIIATENTTIPIQIISYDNPFTLNARSTLVITNVTQCLFTPS